MPNEEMNGMAGHVSDNGHRGGHGDLTEKREGEKPGGERTRAGRQDPGAGRREGRRALIPLGVLRGLAGPGLFSSLGVFFPLIAAAGGGSLGSLSLSVSLASVAGACFLPFAGRLYARFDFRRVTLLGALVMTAAYALYAVSPDPVWRAVLSLPLGCGMVMLVNLMAPCYLRLCGADTGSSLGFLVALSGLVGAIFQPLLARALAAWGWRVAYLLFGLGALAVMGAAALLLPPVPRGDGAHPSAQTPERASDDADAAAGVTSDTVADGADDREMPPGITRAGAFFSLFLFQGVITGFSMFHQHFSTFAAAALLPHRTMTAALTLSMLTAAVGALLLGFFTRRFGVGATGVGVLLLGGASVLLFGFVGGSTAGFLMASALHGAASGAIGVTVPAAARAVYRKEEYSRALSRVMVSSPLFTLLFMQIYGVTYDRTGDFGAALLLLLASLVLTAAVWARAFSARRERRRA